MNTGSIKKWLNPSKSSGYKLSGCFAICAGTLGLLVLLGILSAPAGAHPQSRSTGPAERTTFVPEDLFDDRLRVV